VHEVGERGEGLLDRRVPIFPVELVEIDVVGAQPAQRLLDGLPHVAARPAVRPRRHDRTGEIGAELRRDHDVGATALQDLAEHVLRLAVAIGGVEQRDPFVEGGIEHHTTGVDVERHPEVVAPQSDDGDLEPGIAQPAVPHLDTIPQETSCTA
jgi:hypothetical protein